MSPVSCHQADTLGFPVSPALALSLAGRAECKQCGCGQCCAAVVLLGSDGMGWVGQEGGEVKQIRAGGRSRRKNVWGMGWEERQCTGVVHQVMQGEKKSRRNGKSKRF